MSVLSRTNLIAQMRLDLHHVLAGESYNAYDFRALITSFTGSKPYVLSGFTVTGRTGLALSFSIKDSLTFNPLDGNGSFYKGISTDADVILELPAQQENIFVEARFINITDNPVNTAQWDSLALTGETVAGTEFGSSVDSQVIMQLVISANTIGFTTGSIPLLRASTDGANVTKMVDCRDLMWRLGSGGVTPNPARRFGWGSQRTEPVYSGQGVMNEPNSPFRFKDASGILNDKGISTLKEWADAMMTRLCEISGSSLWYVTDVAPNLPIHGYVTGLDIPRIYLDSESGHSINPSANVSLKWTKRDPTIPHDESSNKYILVSEGQDGLDDISVIKWQVNYGAVTWELGGEFVNNISGGSRAYSASRFSLPNSKAPCDGGNIYLLLERDVVPPLASGNSVKWANNSAFNAYDQTKAVSGVNGDFTGIAVGDWIRKSSEGFSQYYKVMSLSDGVATRTTIGDIADASTTSVELDKTILTGISTEEMTYFRSRYQQIDLFADTVVGEFNYKDSNFYWLGRRSADTFMLRGYGNMQDGEETLVKDDASASGGGGASDIMLVHAKDAVYSALTGYASRAGAVSTIITIQKRKRNNTIFTPDAFASDNSGASLTYTIASPVGSMAVGDGLWVRLSDTTSGVLTNGPVVISNDDVQNLDITTNKWEVRSPTNNPLRNFDNKDVHLLARRITLVDGLTPALIFCDGSIVDIYGVAHDTYSHFTNNTRLEKEVYLGNKTPKSVLFIDQLNTVVDGDPTDAKGRIDEDNVSFNYDKAAQELTLFNNVFGVNYHNIISPEDQMWFQNLGNHTLTLGGLDSSVFIPGNLTVQGSQTIIGSQNTITSDKLTTLGVGNLLYGGGGSGVQIADNTIKMNYIQTYSGLTYVDVTPFVDPLYVLGQFVGIFSTADFDGIPASDISLRYTVVTTGASVGDMQSMGAGVYRIWTDGTATAGILFTFATPILSPVSLFDVLSEIKLCAADATELTMTSWGFGVKRNPNNVQSGNEGTVHAVVTPYESVALAQDFKTIPTARQDNFHRTRIPYAWHDGKGMGAPGSSDTTFDFTDRLTWDYNTNTFRIEGTLQMRGNIIPQDDNTWDIGTTALRWKTIHAGPSSFITHNDNTNTAWASFGYTGALAQITTDAASNLLLRSGSTNQFKLFTDKRGSFGLAQAATGDANAMFEFGNDATNVLAATTQYGTKISQRLSGSVASYLLHIAGVAADVTIGSFASLHIGDVSLAAGAVTSQHGILIDDFSVGTNKYGVYSSMVTGTNKWFLYGGSANSYLSGSLGLGSNVQADLNTHRLVIGTIADTTIAGGMLIGGDVELYRSSANYLTLADNLIVDLTTKLTRQTVVGSGLQQFNSFVTLNGVIPDVSTDVVGFDAKFTANTSHTASITGYLSRPTTANFGIATTIYDMIGYRAAQPTKGTLATVQNMIGFMADDIASVATVNRMAFYSLMAKDAKKWNIYVAGDASNYIAGSVGIGNALQSDIESFRLLIGTTADTTPVKGIGFSNDTNLYRNGVNSLRTDGEMYVGLSAYIGKFANLKSYVASLPAVPATNSLSIFAKDQIIWQRASDGNVIALTNEQGNVYEEEVDVVAVPSGNNQMAVIAPSIPGTNIILPKDRVFLVGNSLFGTTVASGSGVIRVSKNYHGLSNGDIVTVRTSTAIDGIPALVITGSYAITFIDGDTFSIATAGSAITGGITGTINRITVVKTREYLVGQQELEMYLNDVLQRRGIDWGEVGITDSQSNIVKIYRDIKLYDRVTWRLDSNGGQTMIGGGGGGGAGNLQDAYDGGNSIGVVVGTPVSLYAAVGSGILLDVDGTINTTKIISDAYQFNPLLASPFVSGDYGVWLNSSGDLMFRQNTLDINLSIGRASYLTSFGTNGTLVALAQGSPVSVSISGTLQPVNVSDTANATASVGIVFAPSIGVGAIGEYITNGLFIGMGAVFSFGDVIYVDKSMALSNVRPSVGVGGFLAGDYIVKIGVVVRNQSNPLVKDLLVGVQVVGKL